MVAYRFRKDSAYDDKGGYVLELRVNGARTGDPAACGPEDINRFKIWIQDYNRLLNGLNSGAGLHARGLEIYTWLNQKNNQLSRILERPGPPPFFIEFETSELITDDGERAFLEVPWEILAQERKENLVFLAEDDRVQFCPIRRLGEKNT